MPLLPGECPETLKGNKRLVIAHLAFAKGHMENSDMLKEKILGSD